MSTWLHVLGGFNVRQYRERINQGTVVRLLHVPRLEGLAHILMHLLRNV